MILTIFLVSCSFLNSQKESESENSQNENDTEELIDENNNNNVIGYNGIDKTSLGLKVSDNFTISIFADGLSGARNLVGPDNRGNYWLSRTKEGIITMLEVKNFQLINKIDFLTGLNNPHGLALTSDGLTLYFAETNKLSKINLYSDSSPEKIIDLPSGGNHFTRSLLFGQDNKLYISIGSTCDTCYEKDERIATIYRINPDGSDFEKVATGLRNSVFMATNPLTSDIWATEMGRDKLGDDLPPDEINIIKLGNDYGWPLCYGNNIHDKIFDNKSTNNPCIDKTPAHIELQAHSAPLGLSFIPESGWGEEYGNDLLIAYHGSWNRTIPTGYKIVQKKLNDSGSLVEERDFISGWLNEDNKVSGRVVDILTHTGGIAYITDDYKGVIYKLTYNNKDFSYFDEVNFTDEEIGIKANIKVNQNNEILINGEAIGPWFFEAVFGIELVDENNKSLTQWYVESTGEWMTTDYVDFHGKISYEESETQYGYLIFSKANPSGLEEYELEKRIKVKLK